MSRIDDLKRQNPQLDISLIDIIASVDPTSTYKYTPFMVKVLKGELETNDVKKEIGEILFDKEFIDYLHRFEKHCVAQRVTNNDISKYNSIDEIINAVKVGDEIVKQKESEKQIIKLYDKDGYLILIPLTFEASKSYGSGTKWCITQKKYWDQYQWEYRIIYIIDKKNNTKWAVSRKYDNDAEIKGWTAEDTEISPLMMKLPEEIVLFVMKELRKEKFEIELSVLNETNIYKMDGTIIPFDEAKSTEKEWFKEMFGKYIPTTLREKLGIKNNLKPEIKKKSKNILIDDTDIFDSIDDNHYTITTDRITEIMRRLNIR